MDSINYDQLMESAMYGVVQKTLEITKEHGLLGDHHFFITFNLRSPNLEIHDSLIKENLDEMTIVIQHQFSLQNITKDGFGVTLSFNGVKHDLYIPLPAITAFRDPHAKFGLQFLPTTNDKKSNAIQHEKKSLLGNKSPKKKDAAGGGKVFENAENIVTLDNFRKT